MEQEKREKIIKGMESLHGRLLDAAKRDSIAMLDAIIVSDALALLKAQEPRVMTFAEVKAHYNLPPVFVDDLDAQEDYYQDISPLYFEFPNPSSWDVHWRSSNQVRTYLEKWEDRYNKTWRCWTSRPDEATREAIPWE